MRLLENRNQVHQLGGGIRPHRAALLKEGGALLILLTVLLSILIVLSITLPMHTDTTVEAQQAIVQFDNMGGTESQGTLPLRRLQANSSILYRAGGPSEFDIRLFLRGDDNLGGGYSLPLMINGVAVPPLTVTAGLHEYRLRYRLPPAAWNPAGGNIVRIAVSAPETTTTAPLPLALTSVSIQPASVASSLHPSLLLADALIFVALYMALRLAFRGRFRTVAGGLGVGLLILGGFALVFPAQVMYLAQQFGLHPKRTAILTLLLPIGAVALPRSIAYLKRHSDHQVPEEEAPSLLALSATNFLVRDLTLVFIVALGFRLLWALLVPPWQAPDEGAHFTYVAHIVESAELPGIGTPKYGNGPGYSVEFNNSWNNTLFNRISSVGLPRTPELAFLPPNYDYEIARDYQAPAEERQNVAGGTATPYPPLYYLIIAVPYKLFQNEPIISRLFASRIVSAMFGALGCSFAYLMVYEIRRERLWGFSLGLCMALLPMYAFIGSSINNDTAMICGTTALIWATARAFRQQQMSPRLLWSMGVISGCILLVKPTGAVVVILVGLAMLVRQWPLLRYPWRIGWSRIRAIARFTLPIIGMYSSLVFLRILLNRTSTGTSSVAGMNIALVPIYSFRSYIESEFNAGGPYFFWLFIKTFGGVFGWVEVNMPDWSYSALLIFSYIGLVGIGANMLGRKQERWVSLLFLGLIIGQLAFLFIIADYVLSYARLGIGLGLQGRYLFPVLAPILFLLISGWYTLSGRRKFVLYLAPLGMLLLQITALITIITRYYGITFGW